MPASAAVRRAQLPLWLVARRLHLHRRALPGSIGLFVDGGVGPWFYIRSAMASQPSHTLSQRFSSCGPAPGSTCQFSEMEPSCSITQIKPALPACAPRCSLQHSLQPAAATARRPNPTPAWLRPMPPQPTHRASAARLVARRALGASRQLRRTDRKSVV